jgi:hypothetical protein
MRDFLVSILPDPGMVLFVIGAVAIFGTLFAMITDERRYDDPVEHDTAPAPPEPVLDPESDARTRGF